MIHDATRVRAERVSRPASQASRTPRVPSGDGVVDSVQLRALASRWGAPPRTEAEVYARAEQVRAIRRRSMK